MMKLRDADSRERSFPRAGVLLLVLGALAASATAQAQVPPVAARSHSGQFVLVGASTARSLTSFVPQTDSETLELSPMLLPISCERIKQCVVKELGASGAWQGKILLSLRPAFRNDPGALVASERYQNTWQYRVELPAFIDRTVYVRAIVQTVLTEMANRNAGSASTGVPAWLVEGLTRQILSSREVEVILAPPGSSARGVSFTPAFVSEVQDGPLKASHAVLRATGPLSFDSLSWPSQDSFSGPGAQQYGASAQVFVASLLRLGNGKRCMCAWLEALPVYENWQMSFYRAFGEYFQTPLDVEKWWTLQTTYFTGRDLGKSWGAAESRVKLLEILRVPVHVHNSSNTLPTAQSVPIQTVLREWSDPQRKVVLTRKVQELEMLRLRVATNLVEIVERYRVTLAQALEKRSRTKLPFGIGRDSVQEAAAKAAMELDRLDALIGSSVSNSVPQRPMAAAR